MLLRRALNFIMLLSNASIAGHKVMRGTLEAAMTELRTAYPLKPLEANDVQWIVKMSGVGLVSG